VVDYQVQVVVQAVVLELALALALAAVLVLVLVHSLRQKHTKLPLPLYNILISSLPVTPFTLMD